MTRRRLLLEEYHPKVVHISGVDNDAVDALSRLDIMEKANDARVWGEKDCFDDDDMMTIAEVEDPSYPFDLKSMREAQLNDENLIRIVKNCLSGNGKNDTVYTYNTVEDAKLIHKNNQLLVPRSKQKSVLDWYYTILIHPGEARMIESIKLVFTWGGLNKQSKKLVKTCHECQMCKKAGNKKHGLQEYRINEME